MTRRKSELELRDRYARKYAAVLTARAVNKYHSGVPHAVVTVEAEDEADWDDVVEKYEDEVHRHQVKRQLTEVDAEMFQKYVRSIKTDSNPHYHFVFPATVPVKDTGELRILKLLCRRVQQSGANLEAVIEALRPAERGWIDALKGWTNTNDTQACELLQVLHIDFVGHEEELDDLALHSLNPVFGASGDAAWDAVQKYVADKDGVVDIKPEDVWELLPEPTLDEIDTFYWSLIGEAEECLLVSSWVWLTDNLITDLMPEDFSEGIQQFCSSVFGAAWPRKHEDLESAIEAVANHANAYLSHFSSRSTPAQNGWLREDRSYKGFGFNSQYYEEIEKAQVWQRGNLIRLQNLVVALNRLFEQVRVSLQTTYRLRNGKLGIHDTMGVTNKMVGVVYYPDKYRSLD